MKRALVLSVLTSVLALSCPVVAQAEQTGGITYDCDTAADHFSELILPSPSSSFLVKGKLQVMAPAQSRDYVPLARLSISNADPQPGPSSQAWAGFEYVVVPEKKGKAATIPFLNFSVREKGGRNQMEPVAPPSGTEVAFEIRYDGKVASITVDGHSKQVPHVSEQPVVRIVCSTGEFLFTDLRIEASE